MEESIRITVTRGGAIACMIGSAALFLIGLFVLLGYNRVRRGRRLPFESRSVVFLLCTVAATFLTRYLVGVSGVFGAETLTDGEELANSLLHTLQSFSLDESYGAYVLGGRLLMERLFPQTPSMAGLFAWQLSLLHIACALSGGTILYAILARIFPRVRLLFVSLCFWKPICFFSAVNAEALALAESIRGGDGAAKSAQLVFYNADGAAAEHLEQAKLLGGLCLKNALSERDLPRRRGKRIFLIDSEERNLSELARLAANGDRLRRGDEIYRFCESTDGFALDRMARKQLADRNGDDVPLIFPLNRTQRVLYALLTQRPLYTALSENGGQLHVTIFGSGRIGTEAFLHTYWCGQVTNRTLHISVVSDEPEAAFRSRIARIAPELWETADPNADCLRVYPNRDEHAPVYFMFSYTQCDAGTQDVRDALQRGDLIDSDYFIVAVGEDALNIDVADRINRCVSVERGAGRTPRVPLACAICDDGLAKLFAQANRAGGGALDCFPFGTRSELYAFDEIDFNRLSARAAQIKAAYEAKSGSVPYDYRDNIIRVRGEDRFKRDIYAYDANIARAIHTQYKAFCVGMTVGQYAHASKTTLRADGDLAWLEHRRWNAFMRIMGFCCPTEAQEDAYIALLPDAENDSVNAGRHKDIERKLHPCLVECARNAKEPDMLDAAMRRLQQRYASKHFPKTDFKEYDRPRYDF